MVNSTLPAIFLTKYGGNIRWDNFGHELISLGYTDNILELTESQKWTICVIKGNTRLSLTRYTNTQ